MIALIAASAMYLVAGQAAITAPTMALKDCLKQTSAKAKSEKVGGSAYDAYARNACGAQIGALRNALIGFEVKNGTKRADAAKDADLTVDDYVGSSVEKYQYLAGVDADNAKAEAAAAAAAAAKAAAAATPPVQATPAAAQKPPK